MTATMIWIFWLSLAALAFTYAGYPLLLALMVRVFRRKPAAAVPAGETAQSVSVSVVLVVFDEAERIGARIANLLACRCAGELEIVVACDGCSDATAELAKKAGGDQVKVVELAERQGKAQGVNAGVAAASGDIVVFADARQRFDEHAIERLVAAFDDPRVGAASGSLEIEASEAGAGAGIDAYWKLEKFIRSAEAKLDSSIGCSGAIYAIRRELFEPLPEDTVLDDVVLPMRIAVSGSRVLFLADALAFDPQQLAPESERRRKTRTLAGNFQMLFRYPGWLLPWRDRLWWQLIAHKYLRLAGPLLLTLCLVASLALAREHWIYGVAAAAQIGLYLLALVGSVLPRCRWKILTVPAGFVYLQILCLRGFLEWLRRLFTSSGGTW